MKTLEDSIALAMDCKDPNLIPFLPYILQDFWELGSSAESIVQIILENREASMDLEVLDLGCGKGAVSLEIARRIGARCLGIDAIADFIDQAKAEAGKAGLRELCTFTAADAREIIKTLDCFDIIILGSIGPVFGGYFDTLMLLKQHLKERGIIILDDGYIPDESTFEHETVVKKSLLFGEIDRAGMKVLREYVETGGDSSEEYRIQMDRIKTRCRELSARFPEKAILFDDYVKTQEKEYSNLKNDIVCSTLVLSEAE